MKKLSFGKTRGASKGFYIALAISVVAVGTVTYLTLSRLNQSPKTDTSQPKTLENDTSWSIPETESVQKPEVGVPKDIPKVTESVTSEAPVQELPSKPAEVPTIKKPTPASTGAFIMPVAGEILNPFSGGELVKSKTLKEWRTHDGIDIKAAEGTPVKSPNDGKVFDIREDAKWGVTVEVDYPGDTRIIFNGMAPDVKVKKGASIKLGDVIGTVGNTSIVEAGEEMHLHIGVKKNGEWVDPMTVLTKN